MPTSFLWQIKAIHFEHPSRPFKYSLAASGLDNPVKNHPHAHIFPWLFRSEAQRIIFHSHASMDWTGTACPVIELCWLAWLTVLTISGACIDLHAVSKTVPPTLMLHLLEGRLWAFIFSQPVREAMVINWPSREAENSKQCSTHREDFHARLHFSLLQFQIAEEFQPWPPLRTDQEKIHRSWSPKIQ